MITATCKRHLYTIDKTDMPAPDWKFTQAQLQILDEIEARGDFAYFLGTRTRKEEYQEPHSGSCYIQWYDTNNKLNLWQIAEDGRVLLKHTT